VYYIFVVCIWKTHFFPNFLLPSPTGIPSPHNKMSTITVQVPVNTLSLAPTQPPQPQKTIIEIPVHPLAALTSKPASRTRAGDLFIDLVPPSHPRRLRADAQLEVDMVTKLPEGVHLNPSSPGTESSSSSSSFGLAGSGKLRHTMAPRKVKIDGGIAFGEDSATAGLFEIPCGDKIDHVMVLGLWDGHGASEWRDKCSQNSAKTYKQLKEQQDFSELLDAVRRGDTDTRKKMEEDHYKAMDAAVSGGQHSGCTSVTANIYLLHDGRRVVDVGNCGDSPCFMIDNKTGRVWVFSQDHNWDNPTEIEAYLQHCKSTGKKAYTPVYNRVNNGGMEVYNPFGADSSAPFPIFEKDSATIDKDHMDYFWRSMMRRSKDQPMGGSQSHRDRLVEEIQLTDGKWVDYQPVEPHANWGSTNKDELGGGNSLQPTRGLGDHVHKPFGFRCEPSFTVFEVPPELEDITVIVASDGASDWGHYSEFGYAVAEMIKIKPDMTGQEIADSLLHYMFVTSPAKSGMGFQTWLTGERVPRWDDVSLGVTRIKKD